MPALNAAEGRSYGPHSFFLAEDRIAAFVAATHDDPARWTDTAPPGFAAASLFLPAPAFFADPDVAPYTGSVIHADQAFTWHRPWRAGATYEVTGSVDRIRDRRGVVFVTFSMTVDSEGERVLDATSTFLMSSDAPPAGSAEERAEPAVHDRGVNDPLPGSGPEAPLARSASRSDLVRYAAATADFNPIHWDHDAATNAGLPGVVCHGLLLASWLFQAAARQADGDLPLRTAKVRFRTPVPVGTACLITTQATGGTLDLTLESDGQTAVTARVEVTP